MTDDAHPEADRLPGAPHPRETAVLHGHAGAEADFLAALGRGRLHHGWLIAGPRGIGKATLAWRIARHLIATPETPEGGLFGDPEPARTLDPPAGHPALRRIAALSEPRLFLLRRPVDEKTGRLRTEIPIDEVRRLGSFFGMSAADGGRRVVIVDAVDDLNPAAANAVLKLLEEPPAGAVMLLVAHQPARILPTIRSRCRMLRLGPLGPAPLGAAVGAALGEEMPEGAALGTITTLAEGSAGTAVALARLDGAEVYARLVALVGAMPRAPRPALIALAEDLGQRGGGAETRFEVLLDLVDRLLQRIARTGASGKAPPEAVPDEARILHRLAPDMAAGRGWAELAATLTARVRAARAVNLDPATLLVDMLLRIDAAAGSLSRR
ncbi:MAG: DNA polymerase III subunit delta' [Alphaproteobacteria bacterium]|nr:DNA polymerase III subunit delta' [Alphaproteobacteria bacterium]